jgi:hypothetical protein
MDQRARGKPPNKRQGTKTGGDDNKGRDPVQMSKREEKKSKRRGPKKEKK